MGATFASTGPNRDKDVVDMSLVDGYTAPFKLEVDGVCAISGVPFHNMDCSGLSMKSCPTAEHVGRGGTVDLHAKKPGASQASGCYSPCMKLADDKWGHPVGSTSSP